MFIFNGTCYLGHSGFVFGAVQEKHSDTVGKIKRRRKKQINK